MEFKCRNTKEEDLVELVDWWKWHRFTPPVREMLPDDISSGIMVTLDGQNICAGFLYSTSASKLFHIEYIVSTYKVRDKEIRKEALRYLIGGLKYMAKEMGAKIIFTNLVNQNLKKSFLDNDFIVGSKNSEELICLI